MPSIEKDVLLQELKDRLNLEFDTLARAHQATQAGATHEENKPENDKDTRALEQSYLARGQAVRVAKLSQDLDLLAALSLRSFGADSKVATGALVKVLDEEEREQLYFIAPAGAGEVLVSQGESVKVVTPSSPLGRSLMGAEVEDDVKVSSPAGLRMLSLIEIS